MIETRDRSIMASTEFVSESWGQGDATVVFYAPLTRENGMIWLHPAWAREYPWEEITRRATRIWKVTGSLWNPREFVLIWGMERRSHGRNGNP